MNFNGFTWHVGEEGNGVIDGFSGESSTIEIPENLNSVCTVTAIGEYAFECCDGLECVVLPGTLRRIGECAFWGCSRLAKVEFQDGLEYLGDGSFYSCPLEEIYLPLQLKNSIRDLFIGDKHVPLAYQGDTDCFEVFTRQGLKKIRVSKKDLRYSSEDGVLFDKSKETLLCYPPRREAAYYAVPFGTAVIGEDAFSGSVNLREVILPDTLKCIEDYAFSGAGIKKLRIPAGVEKIGRHAFSRGILLTSAAD